MHDQATFDRYMTPDEERRLLGAVRRIDDVLARRDHAWMRALLHTGVRIQAFSRLTLGDVRAALRLQPAYLHLSAAIQKGQQAHRVYLNAAATRAFKDLLRINRQMRGAQHDDAPLVLERRGGRLSVRSYQARLRGWCAEAGLEGHVTPHWFRHTLAKRVLARTTHHDPLGVVQRVLGHRSRASTAIYAAPDKEDVERALDDVA